MANRRSGGMGGLQRGARNSQQFNPFQGGGGGGNNVNPWQGSPGLGSNNSMSAAGGLISQITSNPQQLALALTSLLQPQHQSPQQHPINQANPPSLLSLNTSPAFPAAAGNQNRFDRFGGGGGFGNRGREFRRHEPYTKNRNAGGWRPMDNNRNRRRDGGGNNKKQGGGGNDKNKKQNQKSEKQNIEKKVTEIVNESKDIKDIRDPNDINFDESHDGEEESKRDWKDEKNDAAEKANPEESIQADDSKTEEKKSEQRAGRYHDIPTKFLNCFVCNKEMWDGESMNKHIKGRAHKQMLKSLEESIHITVNILRENMRLAEEKKVIEWNRMHRLKKFNKYNEPESHCNMCDLKFLGKIITHRKTEAHQRLKRYLHPNCSICSKEFPSRIEWVEHRLTPDHLRKLNEVLSAKEGGIDGAKVIQEGEEEPDLEPILEESVQMEAENPVLELDDDLTGLQNLIPAYKKDRPVSTKSLIPFEGFLCTLCNRSFNKEELAQSHLKSRRHYYAFVDAAKQKYKKQQDDAKKAEEEKKKKEKEEAVDKKEDADENNESQNGENEDQEMYDPEEACNGNNEGDEDDDVVHIPDEEAKVEIVDEDKIKMEEDEQEDDEKEEEKPAPKTPAARGRRSGLNRPGPKSKKARKN